MNLLKFNEDQLKSIKNVEIVRYGDKFISNNGIKYDNITI